MHLSQLDLFSKGGVILIDGRLIRPRDIAVRGEQLTTVLDNKHLMPLPAPFEDPATWPKYKEMKPEWRDTYYAELDGVIALEIGRAHV